MAKTQQRYRAADWKLVLPGLTGEVVSLILEDRQVYQVKIKSLHKDQLLATDALFRVHKFSLDHIEEVIVEKHA